MGLFYSILSGFLPMLFFAAIVYWLDRYEKEPLLLLGLVFVWGAVVAAGGSFLINSILGAGVYQISGSQVAAELTTGSVIAPIVEECLKGFAVLIVFLSFRNEFDSALDGVVYASVVALGFAATENVYYIYQYGFADRGLAGLLWLVFVRVVLVGWQHPFYTAFTGIGLATARMSRSVVVKLIAPLGGLSLAILAHSLHNTVGELLSGTPGVVVGTAADWTGWFFMLLFILWSAARERDWIRRYLKEEVTLGMITEVQYQEACSSWGGGRWVRALLNRRYAETSYFYQLCAELAHKKNQFASFGEEGGNSAIIASLRAELGRLSPRVLG